MGPDLTAWVAPVVVDDRFLAGIEEQAPWLPGGGTEAVRHAANLKRRPLHLCEWSHCLGSWNFARPIKGCLRFRAQPSTDGRTTGTGALRERSGVPAP